MHINIFPKETIVSSVTPPLTAGDIHIYFLSLDDREYFRDMIAALPACEHERAEKYAHDTDKMRCLIGHAALRHILGKYLGCDGISLTFSTNAHGKPALSRPDFRDDFSPKGHISFNLSHSGSQIALAFSADTLVGIDIEKADYSVRMKPIVNRFFHPDEKIRFDGPDTREQATLFFRYWTIREAFLKALGTGFTIPSDSFCIEPSSDGYTITKSWEDYSAWQIQSVPCADGYFCSVAYKHL